jgi:hypothetical protein
MRRRYTPSMLVIVAGASLLSSEVAAQVAGAAGMDLTCPNVKLHGNRGMTLTRLCVDALYARGDGLGADAACAAATDEFTKSAALLEQLTKGGERDSCISQVKLAEQKKAIDYVLAFLRFRQSGHVPPPQPQIVWPTDEID